LNASATCFLGDHALRGSRSWAKIRIDQSEIGAKCTYSFLRKAAGKEKK